MLNCWLCYLPEDFMNIYFPLMCWTGVICQHLSFLYFLCVRLLLFCQFGGLSSGPAVVSLLWIFPHFRVNKTHFFPNHHKLTLTLTLRWISWENCQPLERLPLMDNLSLQNDDRLFLWKPSQTLVSKITTDVVSTHLNVADLLTGLTEVLTPDEDQLIECVWLAAPSS